MRGGESGVSSMGRRQLLVMRRSSLDAAGAASSATPARQTARYAKHTVDYVFTRRL
jgi:hypothetical protein